MKRTGYTVQLRHVMRYVIVPLLGGTVKHSGDMKGVLISSPAGSPTPRKFYKKQTGILQFLDINPNTYYSNMIKKAHPVPYSPSQNNLQNV